ncbi:hypothetical protein HMPREF1425_01250 [Helicobacter pylori GAM71Ai]|nr:hypothetical protein HMPREF1425_01250 [Helicobacter pylori GAM71Ai]
MLTKKPPSEALASNTSGFSPKEVGKYSFFCFSLVLGDFGSFES